MHKAAADADVVVMAAAVADFRPAAAAGHKIKKIGRGARRRSSSTENPDVLAELVAAPAGPGQVIVGFAAETGDDDGDVLEHGRAKLARKGCDLLVVNAVGDGQGVRPARQRRGDPRRRRQRDRRAARPEGRAGRRGLGRGRRAPAASLSGPIDCPLARLRRSIDPTTRSIS